MSMLILCYVFNVKSTPFQVDGIENKNNLRLFVEFSFVLYILNVTYHIKLLGPICFIDIL